MIQNLAAISNEKLIGTLKEFRKSENVLVADIVRYLVEVDSRQLYRDQGYPSLFAFCTEALGYSGGATHRRIVAARCMSANPEVYDLLKEGKVSLCALSEVAKVLTPENKTEVLTLTQGLPKQEAQKLAAQYQVATPPKRESIRAKQVLVEVPVQEKEDSTITAKAASTDKQFAVPTSTAIVIEQRFSIKVEVDQECMDLIEDAKRYSGKVKLSEVFKLALKDYVKRKQPKVVTAPVITTAKVEAKPVKNQESRVLKPARYIPRKVKDEVRIRDHQRCTYVSPEGRRCNETIGLQFDHCQPFAFGGKNDSENLRLRCPAHNQLYADQVFGREFMDQKRVQR